MSDTSKDNSQPAWSPDGKKIACTGYELPSADVYVINADGSSEMRITDGHDNWSSSWSPNGKQILRRHLG